MSDFLAALAGLALVAITVAWWTILPTIGVLWLLGWLP